MKRRRKSDTRRMQIYYAWMDTVINNFLIKHGGLSPTDSPIVGYCVESQCTSSESVAFPDTVQCGLRVGMFSLSTPAVSTHQDAFRKAGQQQREVRSRLLQARLFSIHREWILRARVRGQVDQPARASSL